MQLRQDRVVTGGAGSGGVGVGGRADRSECAWGPFTGRQLTTIVCVAIVSVVVAVPTAALAASGAFTSATTAPAVVGTNSSAASGAAGVVGSNTGGGPSTRYGVRGGATGPGGIGVQGNGKKYGVFSNGPLGVASGKALTCTRCVSPGDLSSGVGVHAKARIASNATVTRSTPGVTVTNPFTGDYCVQFPAGVVTGDEVVIVSPDFFLSPDSNVETQWAEGSGGCPVGQEEIFTWGGPKAGPLAPVNEGFDLIVT